MMEPWVVLPVLLRSYKASSDTIDGDAPMAPQAYFVEGGGSGLAVKSNQNVVRKCMLYYYLE